MRQLSLVWILMLVMTAAVPLMAAEPEPAHLSVVATGVVRAAPDEVSIYAQASGQSSTVKEAQQECTKTLDTVLAKLKDVGIAKETVTTSAYTIAPVTSDYGGSSNPPRVLGYRVTAPFGISIPVQGGDVSKANTRISEVAAALTEGGGRLSAPPGTDESSYQYRGGGGGGNYLVWRVKDDRKYRDEALQKAIAQARPLAEQMAKTLGVTIKGLRSVYYNVETGMQPGPMRQTGGATSLTSGEVEFRAQVTLDYNIIEQP